MLSDLGSSLSKPEGRDLLHLDERYSDGLTPGHVAVPGR